MSTEENKIVVAMSGGVDSSVAALLLHSEGHDVVGVSMQVWDYRNNGGCSSRATCCSPDDFTDARKVADRIGIPYYVFDFEKTFRKEVIDNFVETYRIGKTPNPCVDCNTKVKFKELRERADSLGYQRVATGHYAKVSESSDGFHLLRGDDPEKDQSYFLYTMNQDELSRTLFPVGGYKKAEVRELAEQYNLPTADKPESQDICFVSGELKHFLQRAGLESKRGSITNSAGKVLGEHDGIQNFTVGQRRGLNIGGSDRPLYVLSIIPESNTVVVGEREELQIESFAVQGLHWVSPAFQDQLPKKFECISQLRHRHAGCRTKVELEEDGTATVSFLDEWTTVCPGQAAVFYDMKNQELIGGGRIS